MVGHENLEAVVKAFGRAVLGYRPTPPYGQKTHKLPLMKADAYMMWEPADLSGS